MEKSGGGKSGGCGEFGKTSTAKPCGGNRPCGGGGGKMSSKCGGGGGSSYANRNVNMKSQNVRTSYNRSGINGGCV